ITYTDFGNGVANRCEDTLDFGDGSKGIAYRTNGASTPCGCGAGVYCGVLISTDQTYMVNKSTYTISHTYAGPGNYRVRMFDPNRNQGVINIPNSVNQPFCLESYLVINSFTGANSSPTFSFDPTDRACVQKCFYHNPGAYDPDGDSLSFEITESRGDGGAPIPGYVYPDPGPGGIFGIDALSGTVTWCSPQLAGEYNIAFVTKEWRKNTSGIYKLVGYVLRDMQVVVKACPDVHSPDIIVPTDTCVEAGTLINKIITVKDIDNEAVTIVGSGGAFNASSPAAALSPTTGLANPSYTTAFTWQTTCSHIRQQPYISILKAEDQTSPPKLVYFKNYNITVVPPSVKNVSATPIGTTIKITWAFSTCNPSNNPLVTYKIYRKADCSPFVYTPCEQGVTAASGYTFIGQTLPSINSFTDNNAGNGLVVGTDYSYLVVAVYNDGSQSYASSQVCARLKRDVPVILNVDILSTSASTGSVFIRWVRPLKTSGNFDTLVFPGPYQFNLKYRAGSSNTFTTIFNSTQNMLYQLDTSYIHQNVNTVATDQEYMVEFIAGTVTIGSSQKATSVFLSAAPGDRRINLSWSSVTPWNNYKYTVYRKDPGSSSFVATATTSLTHYKDSVNIANRATYCYKISSEGKYSDTTIYKPLLNNSQEVCATAVDNTPPCTPSISIVADCPAGYVNVEWNDVTKSCGDDVVKYLLYKKETVDEDYVLIATINTPSNTSYTFDGLALINSCFAIQAVDSSGNVSPFSQDYCVDNCPEFELPNIVTLNNDGINDYFKAIKVRQIKQIDLYIYDRWGNLVYKTTDPYFKWNCVSILTNKAVSEGTFFYICDVYEPRVEGVKKRNLKGYMQVVK
ncbi:MAG: T9SS type B sorting domain-containing protein, partial [Bacteroidia bacterium]